MATNELWAIVEVMGHAQYAGRVSQYAELGVPLVRVEVPETRHQPAFEKLLGAAAVFRITPVEEEVARRAAEQFAVRPLALIHLPAVEPGRIAGPPDWLEEEDEE